MIRRLLSLFSRRRPEHVWTSTGIKPYADGCGGPYDYEAAVASRQRALDREKAARKLADRFAKRKADVVRMDDRRQA